MEKTFGAILQEKLTELRYPENSKYLKWFSVYPLPIIGCTDDEIQKLKTIQNVTYLPKLYVEFMSYMGKACGDIFIGYDVTYRYISKYDMRGLANQVLSKDGQQTLGNDQFVFMNLQGHSFWFFPVNEGDDPPVYLYVMDDGEDDPEYPFKQGSLKVEAYLSNFLTRFIAERESIEEQQRILEQYAVPYR
jgi:hypothetical protein